MEHPGELVTREELVNRLWPTRTFVDFDRGLNKAINHLREVLGDSAEQPHFIETLPRKGYRFVAPVIHGDEEGSCCTLPRAPRSARESPSMAGCLAEWHVRHVLAFVAAANIGGARTWITRRLFPAPPQIASLAVIPLENLSRDPEQEYFADGMTDALITDLAKMSSVRVTSRTSIMRYKGTKKSIAEIGRELNVDAVVEGTVTRSGNRVADHGPADPGFHRHASVGRGLRARRERDPGPAKRGSDRHRPRVNILVRPLDQARAVNPQAYGFYLKGRYFFYQYTSQGWQQSIDHFRQAIESDPNFAPAYSGLADSYLVAGTYGAIPATGGS